METVSKSRTAKSRTASRDRRVPTVAMETAGKSRVASRDRLISVGIIVLAAALAIYAFHESTVHPTTTDSSIDADIVHVAAAVGGRIIELPVSENARVAAGDLLFQIDPLPYRLAVEQAAADLNIAEAELETRRRVLSTQRSDALIAANQTKNALQNHELAMRSLERIRPLASKGYVPKQQLDDAQVTHLQEIVAARQTSMTSTARQMQELQAQLEQALATPSADPAAVGKIVLAIRALTEESGRQQETFRAAFAASLTAEQRQRVETMRSVRTALAGAAALERLGL